MLSGFHPVVQSLMGTLLTWGLTAAGAGMVFIFHGSKRNFLDGSLGFAAGVMLAASYWSLLAPAIEMAEASEMYGSFCFLPISLGFVAGGVFVYLADLMLPILGLHSTSWAVAVHNIQSKPPAKVRRQRSHHDSMSDAEEGAELSDDKPVFERPLRIESSLRSRRPDSHMLAPSSEEDSDSIATDREARWRRILLLIIAITVHNIPEGLAVGVGFGAIGKSPSATLERARNLALGIGIQNFPEGLAVSIPLRAAGMDVWKSFWYGQLSGVVEPLAGVLGAMAVVVAEPLLPYALAFAAGAMVYVVVDDIIPEAHSCGNGRLASFCVMIGFIVMMSLDVGLG